MWQLVALCALAGAASAGSPIPPAAVGTVARWQRGDSELVRVFDLWLRSYRRGRIDMRKWRGYEADSLVLKSGLLADPPARITPFQELQVLLDGAVREASPAAVLRVLHVAGIGLDRFHYGPEHALPKVRAMGQEALGRCHGHDVDELLLSAAAGDEQARFGMKAALRAAALRAIGKRRLADGRAILENALGESDEVLRLAAADGLAALCAADSALSLVRAVEREKSEAPLIAVVQALAVVLSQHRDDAHQQLPALAVEAVLGALRRTSWRGDIALLQFLQRFRSVRTIPVLIDLLDLYRTHSSLVASGALTGEWRSRVHGVLMAITGAAFPADAVDQWREFWEQHGEGFELAPEAAAGARDESGTVARFFGVPVRGTRVVFVIDVSGSMREPMDTGETAPGGEPQGERPSKLDVARRELRGAIERLPDNARFNLVLFSRDVTTWRKKLVVASAENKRRAADFIDVLFADDATNLWGGLQLGLGIRSLVYGDRYESNVDELFVLSDGAATEGELVDPASILDAINETNRFSQVRINTVYLAGSRRGGWGGRRGRRGPGRGGPGRGGRGPGGGPGRGGPGWPGGRGPGPQGPGGEGWMSAEELMRAIAKANGGVFVKPTR